MYSVHAPISPCTLPPCLTHGITKQLTRLNEERARHSFGSYRPPGIQSAAQLALEMGNSEKEVFESYRELVTPGEVDAFWQIAPASSEITSATFASA